MLSDFSSQPVTREQIDTAAQQFLSDKEPGIKITVKHSEGGDKNEVYVITEGGDNIQGFMLHMAIVMAEENSVSLDGELLVDKEAIANTFYGYASKISRIKDKPGVFALKLAFEPDLFTVLTSDPSLGLP